ncbi:MAG: cation-translocating P-type ATPase [Anaerolineales bacterium]|nr:cation-translocating P-type ATPase [Anaerolineales bacterium]
MTSLNAPAPWHTLDHETTLEHFSVVSAHGLSTAQAEQRLADHGPNELIERGAKSPWAILWEQVTAIMVVILIGAGLLSAVLGKWTEAIAILAIVVLFVALGFLQEYRAERAIAALKKLTVPLARVIRDGQMVELPARELVPGDVIALEAGNLVPADVRLLESASLRVQEAALTGESEPVDKAIAPIAAGDAPLGDRLNMAYRGTQVSHGRGRAVVVATGMQTELGRIADLIQDVRQGQTPLQRKLDQVGKLLAIVGTVVAVLILLIGVLRGESFQDMVLTAISVAVAVVPEGLPAVVTFTLALGAQRMLARNALIRKLPAVETLGSVTVICSDKTGTLTENRMTVTVVETAGEQVDLAHLERGQAVTPKARLVLLAGALANDAQLQRGPDGQTTFLGDPTEGALLVAAERAGIDPHAVQRALPRATELPFDSGRKRMTTVHDVRTANGATPPELAELTLGHTVPAYVAFVKGSVDGLLDCSTSVWDGTTRQPLTDEWRARINASNQRLAAAGQRVLGFAARAVATPTADPALETDLVFIGLVGMIDPPRPEARAAAAIAARAGIRPIMITGDHPLTARAIAQDLGITSDDRVVTGAELEKFSDAQLSTAVQTTSVFARVAPEHKLRIVAALQAQGHVVAMTGDGVNDAPALKQADIGVAMGITGTDVSKEAAAMVLRDDNFATIVAAVEEGRTIYDNVRRFVKFSLAGNVAKVLVMLLWPAVIALLSVPAAIDPVALRPLQLLWLNLMTDGLLGLGLGVELAERDVMRRPPVSPRAGIFSDGLGQHVAWLGLWIGALTLGVGLVYAALGRSEWQTMMFSTLAFAQIFQALGTRSIRDSFFRLAPLGNRLLIGMVGLVTALQLIVLYTPASEAFFGVQALAPIDLAVTIGLGAATLGVMEIEKALLRRRPARD